MFIIHGAADPEDMAWMQLAHEHTQVSHIVQTLSLPGARDCMLTGAGS